LRCNGRQGKVVPISKIYLRAFGVLHFRSPTDAGNGRKCQKTLATYDLLVVEVPVAVYLKSKVK